MMEHYWANILASIDAILDDRDFTPIPIQECYHGWGDWASAAVDGTWA